VITHTGAVNSQVIVKVKVNLVLDTTLSDLRGLLMELDEITSTYGVIDELKTAVREIIFAIPPELREPKETR
jgi:hypothetical protein